MPDDHETFPFSASAPYEERSDHKKPGLRRAILVCEDDESIRELLLEAFREEGFRVDEARNGREALECLRRSKSRYLILLDLMMPDISGYEILERLNADPQLLGEHIVLVISATGFTRPVSPGIIEKRLVKGVLRKPFELDELFALVQRWA